MVFGRWGIAVSMAAFSETGKRSENVDTLVVISLTPRGHRLEHGGAPRIIGSRDAGEQCPAGNQAQHF